MRAIFKLCTAILVIGSAGFAPFQCASEPDPNKLREETPGEALYGLAQDFKKSGDRESQIRTLSYLVARYPGSRHAESAKADLQELGAVASDASSVPVATASPPAPASTP